VKGNEAVPAALRAQLADLYRHQVLEGARFERGLELRVRALREGGIEPVVIKGWSIARRYPAKGLRHYSDLDLVVRRDQVAAAERILSPYAEDRLAVDLHPFMPHVEGRDAAALQARLLRVPLGAIEVTTLGDEDHLWLLALHALGHGLWRMIWLVDLAVLVEARAETLDWDYLFAGPPNNVRGVEVALTLTHTVLGARLDNTPIARLVERQPRWVEPALLRQWAEPYQVYAPITAMPRLGAILDEARRRWPNPIRATAAAHGPWNELPRLPLQTLDFARRLARYARSRDASQGIWKR